MPSRLVVHCVGVTNTGAVRCYETLVTFNLPESYGRSDLLDGLRESAWSPTRRPELNAPYSAT
ncbi:hypothetical protein GCM10010324_23840 [Streptomyces hiroshimensis]|uniref:Uncharacterized protein n=1 Tax=Streptomyces hiroshimensis TaxID=66424 RepID=A0ABQ2YBF9_9ACTN|nr:hypothetical protein GCM10010324_23840 [Streptomyces hiroshimensis]